MRRLRRAAIIWIGSIVMPIALGVVCAAALDPLGSGTIQPVAASKRLAMATCGVGAIVAWVIVAGVLITELIVLALTALLDLVVARWIPRGTRLFAIYRAFTGIVGGFIGGGLIGLPFAQALVLLPALLIGPLIGLILNLPVGRRLSPFMQHRAQQQMAAGRLGLLGVVARGRRAFRVWAACVVSGAAAGLGLAATGLVSADLDLGVGVSATLTALGLAYAIAGYVAALAAWCGFLAVAMAVVISVAIDRLSGGFGRVALARQHGASLVAGLVAGAAGAGLGAWMIGEMAIMVAALGLGAVAGLAVTWPHLQR